MPEVGPQGKASQIVWTLSLAIRVAHSNVTVCAVLVLLPSMSGLDLTGDKSCDATMHSALILA